MRILMIILVSVAIVAAAVASGYYLILKPRVSHPSEDTARYLPQDTSVYYSINLRPGLRQIDHAIGVFEIFKYSIEGSESYSENWTDNRFDDFEDETGIDLEEEFFPWVGPEIAVGLVDYAGYDSEVVVFLGTTDDSAVESFVESLLDYLRKEGDLEIKKSRSDGSARWSVSDEFGDISLELAITDGYLLVSTDDGLLNETISMMDNPTASLYDDQNFQLARNSIADPRFSMLYFNTTALIDDVAELTDDSYDYVLDQVADNLPGYIGISASFFKNGIRITQTSNSDPGKFGSASNNQVSSADTLPVDTLVFISGIGVYEGWETLKANIDQKLEEFNDVTGSDALDIGYDSFDELLRELEEESGVDVDDDLFGWMRGEAAIAWLPSDITLREYQSDLGFEEGQLQVLGIAELVDGRARRDAKSGIPSVMDFMWGNNFEEKTILGQKALVDEYLGYGLGYMFLEDRVVMGSTTSALRRALDTDVRGRLSETENFKLMMEESSGSPDWLMYANLRGIIEMATGVEGDCDMARCLTELRDYVSEIGPFLAPLDMISLTSSVNEKDRSFTVLLSVSSPETHVSNPAVGQPGVVPQLFPSTSTP